MKSAVILGTFLTMAWCGIGESAVWNVGPGRELTSIQTAIETALSGDTVIVDPGTYYEHIDFLGKNIILTSTSPEEPGIVATTIIDGGGSGSVVTFTNGENAEAQLIGFTITGGKGTPDVYDEYTIYWGGGVYCSNSSPTITGNVITGNYGPAIVDDYIHAGFGGGVCLFLSQAVLNRNVIHSNTAYLGGGVLLEVAEGMISNNVIYDNIALYGGGVGLERRGMLLNNTICHNSAEYEGGNLYGYVDESSIIANNIFAFALEGGGVYLDVYDQQGYFMANCVWSNSGGDYTGDINTSGVLGNIELDPLFTDAAGRDYHLQSNSPCISSGVNDWRESVEPEDIDGDVRIFALRVDMGADEFIGYVKPVAWAGEDQVFEDVADVTLDGSSSYFDPSVMDRFYTWTQTDGPAVELDVPDAAVCHFTPTENGIYWFELTVSDGVNPSSSDGVMIRIGNSPPVANAGENQTAALDAPVVLNGQNSYDPDPQTTLSYNWTQTSGPEVELLDADSATPVFTATVMGVYTFDLVVNDGQLNSVPDGVQVNIVGLTVTETPLTYCGFSTSDDFHYPDISETQAVYSVGYACDFTWNIHVKDLSSSSKKSFASGDIDTQPKIDGNLVTWFGGINWGNPWYHEPCNTSIFLRDLNTNTTKKLRSYTWSSSYSHPVIANNIVVWLEHLGIDPRPTGSSEAYNWWNTPFNVCGADVSDFNNPVYFTIAVNVGRRDPYPCHSYWEDYDDVIDINGVIAVWEADGDIYAADLSDLSNIRTYVVCDDPAMQYDPAIYGNLVVWTDHRNDQGDIYAADLTNLDMIETFPLIIRSGTQQHPAIDENILVYVDEYYIQASFICSDRSPLNLELSQLYYGAVPAIKAGNIIWEDYENYGKVEGIHLDVIYKTPEGPVLNVRTGDHYDLIQHALNQAQNGDIIELADHTYKGFGNYNMAVKCPNIILRSVNGPMHCIINCQGSLPLSRRAFYLSSQSQDTVIEGITIKNGYYFSNSSKYGWRSAGAVYGINTQATLRNCIIHDCHSDYGGAIHMAENCTLQLNNCTLTGNSAANRGGAILGRINTQINCLNNIIYYNSSPFGSQFYLRDSVLNISHTDWQDGADCVVSEGDATIVGLLGCITDEPCFVDCENDDFLLKSCGWRWNTQRNVWSWDDITSPCIDTGCPGSLLGDEPLALPEDPSNVWGENLRINMGAYGGTVYASMGPCNSALLTDASNDDIVDATELLCLSVDWLAVDNDLPTDFNRDGEINLLDVSILMNEWLQQVEPQAAAASAGRSRNR